MTPRTAAEEAICDAYQWAADVLLTYHTNPWELDAALENAGYAMGPCLRQDAEGLEHAYARRKSRRADPDVLHVPSVDRAVEEGRLGRSVGWGWYRYPGGGGPVEDPLVEDLLTEEAWLRKMTRSDLDDAQIVHRMDLAIGNAALAVIGQTLASGRDVDRIASEALHRHSAPKLTDMLRGIGPDDFATQLAALDGPLRGPWRLTPHAQAGWQRLKSLQGD